MKAKYIASIDTDAGKAYLYKKGRMIFAYFPETQETEETSIKIPIGMGPEEAISCAYEGNFWNLEFI